MKQRPILFSTPMVQAILAGTKTQTRRTITKHRSGPCGSGIRKKDLDWDTLYQNNPFGVKVPIKKGAVYGMDGTVHRVYPPYEAGDHLWVRETFFALGKWRFNGKPGRCQEFRDLTIEMNRHYMYQAGPVRPAFIETKKDGLIHWYKRPSIFMPREASRITLEITDIRAERLNDISAEDAEAEGITWGPDQQWSVYHKLDLTNVYRSKFYELWESINGRGSWRKNPWVWVVKYRRSEQ